MDWKSVIIIILRNKSKYLAIQVSKNLFWNVNIFILFLWLNFIWSSHVFIINVNIINEWFIWLMMIYTVVLL